MGKHLATASATRDRLIPFPEALATLGISKSNAYRLLEREALPRPIKIGARTFFSDQELQAWIANKLAARGREIGDAVTCQRSSLGGCPARTRSAEKST